MMTKPATLRPARRRRALSSLTRRASRRKAARTRVRRPPRDATNSAQVWLQHTLVHVQPATDAAHVLTLLLLTVRGPVSGVSGVLCAGACGARRLGPYPFYILFSLSFRLHSCLLLALFLKSRHCLASWAS